MWKLNLLSVCVYGHPSKLLSHWGVLELAYLFSGQSVTSVLTEKETWSRPTAAAFTQWTTESSSELQSSRVALLVDVGRTRGESTMSFAAECSPLIRSGDWSTCRLWSQWHNFQTFPFPLHLGANAITWLREKRSWEQTCSNVQQNAHLKSCF